MAAEWLSLKATAEAGLNEFAAEMAARREGLTLMVVYVAGVEKPRWTTPLGLAERGRDGEERAGRMPWGCFCRAKSES